MFARFVVVNEALLFEGKYARNITVAEICTWRRYWFRACVNLLRNLFGQRQARDIHLLDVELNELCDSDGVDSNIII